MKRKGLTFAQARKGLTSLAIRPAALSLFWLFGCGHENEVVGRSSVVTIEGPLEQRAGWWDGYDAIQERFKAALKDESTSSVILRIDSPGGDAAGCFEAVRAMRTAAKRSGKRVVTYVDEGAYSAAYALACVGEEIVMPESGGVGSVGVIATCIDRVAMNKKDGINVEVIYAGDRKADCHPDMPLTDEALSIVQNDVDRLASLFFSAVADARGISAGAVEALQAATLMGDAALESGLADRIMGFDELVAMLATEETTGASAPTKERMAMKGKKVSTPASQIEASDVLAKPQVAIPDASTLEAARGMLGRDAGVQAGTSKTDGSSSETTVETNEECDEDGSTTSTTTTTTTETETVGAAVSDDEEGDDEEGDDEEGDDDKDASAVQKSVAMSNTRMVTGDVLKCVRELTGVASPAEQVGALRAMHDASKRAAKAERKAAKSEHSSKVDAAIRAGKLSPAKRAEALAMAPDEFAGYMRLAVPMVRQASKPAAVGTKPPTSGGATSYDAATLSVARTMGLDPEKLVAHSEELRKQGVFH